MKLHFAIAALIITAGFTSCDRTYDCTCTVRGTQSTYVQEISAPNADDGRDKCLEYQDEHNRVAYPGIDCDLK